MKPILMHDNDTYTNCVECGELCLMKEIVVHTPGVQRHFVTYYTHADDAASDEQNAVYKRIQNFYQKAHSLHSAIRDRLLGDASKEFEFADIFVEGKTPSACGVRTEAKITVEFYLKANQQLRASVSTDFFAINDADVEALAVEILQLVNTRIEANGWLSLEAQLNNKTLVQLLNQLIDEKLKNGVKLDSKE